jgi:uncharacterized membrane protein YwaF
MRTAIIIAIGFIVLAAFVLLPRVAGRPEWSAAGAKIFIALWLLAALANLWVGVSRAGYTVLEELPIFLLIFAIPAALAAYVWWKFG